MVQILSFTLWLDGSEDCEMKMDMDIIDVYSCKQGAVKKSNEDVESSDHDV